jgi:SAM-dependent methyltransferase
MLSLLKNMMRRLRTEGVRSTGRLIVARCRGLLRSFLEDRKRGLSTARAVKDRELGITDARYHWYVATDYETFERAMRHVDFRPNEDVFVDFGSGKGRIVLLAAQYPFRRVIGVEFAEALNAVARQNHQQTKHTLKCKDVKLIQADATQWSVPHDATVLFFFNPFDGAILAQVCANIQRSLAEAPRKITIIYVRPDKFFEKEISWQSWLVRRVEIPCLEGKVSIYESTPLPADCKADERIDRGVPSSSSH